MATPREAGYYMPAEWAPHAGCWMAWPCRLGNFDDIERARATYVEIARAVARFEPVTMTANTADLRPVRRALAGTPGIEVVELPSDDSWARDSAPTFLVDGRGGLAGVDWRFNAYGGIYEDYTRTANMARRILDLVGARRFAAPLVLEGGRYSRPRTSFSIRAAIRGSRKPTPRRSSVSTSAPATWCG